MSKFVDYNKREFTLPAGCKDLIDVLRPRPMRSLAASATAGGSGVTCGSQAIARLSEVPRYITRLLRSRAAHFTVMISTPDGRFHIVLYRSGSQRFSALLLLSSDAGQQREIRGFFERHGIKALQDYLIPPDAGSEPLRALTYPLANAAPTASQITTDLLRTVYGVTDETELQFQHYEIK